MKMICVIKMRDKNFDIFLDCSLGSLVFETSSSTGGRLDYVHAKDRATALKVDECSDENGSYAKSLGDNWYLCHGDWN